MCLRRRKLHAALRKLPAAQKMCLRRNKICLRRYKNPSALEFPCGAGEKRKVHATDKRKKLNREIFKGGQAKQVPVFMNMGGVLKNRGGTFKGTY